MDEESMMFPQVRQAATLDSRLAVGEASGKMVVPLRQGFESRFTVTRAWRGSARRKRSA